MQLSFIITQWQRIWRLLLTLLQETSGQHKYWWKQNRRTNNLMKMVEKTRRTSLQEKTEWEMMDKLKENPNEIPIIRTIKYRMLISDIQKHRKDALSNPEQHVYLSCLLLQL